jgi:hypothetical protein
MVEITVRGDPTTWRHVPFEPWVERIPRGCVAREYLEMLGVVTPSLLEEGPVSARVNGASADPQRVLCAGDQVTVTRASSESTRPAA